MSYTPPQQGLSPFSHPVGELVKGAALTVAPDTPVEEAARRMCEAGVGSLVVAEDGRPVGILTKTDLVARVLVPALPPETPVRAVLTAGLVTIERHEPIFEGLLRMIQHDIGHLVVIDNGRLAGVVSERDWLTFQERHPAALLRELEAAGTVQALADLRARANRLVGHLFRSEGTAEALTRIVTEINDRVVRRVIELELAALAAEGAGAPPAPFAWVAMGSEGRAEQTLSTDQDNGLVFADVPPDDAAPVQAWFLRLAARVVDALEVCGFPRCKGNVMASNPELCLPLEGWRRKFDGYLAVVDEEALLRASIHFDFRAVSGDAALVDALWAHLLERMGTNRGFLRHLAGHALEGRPPVNTFGWRLRSWLGLEHPPLDLKRQALAPLVASARVAALAAGSDRTNTVQRLAAARDAGALPEGLASAAHSAFDLLMLLRFRQHFGQQEAGRPPTNLLVIEDLNPLRREFLAGALQAVIHLQDHVFHQYGGVTLP